MKKGAIRILTIISIITLAFMLRSDLVKYFHGPTAYAVGDLFVDWGVPEGEPIFSVSNMAPGDDEFRTVVIHNDASQERPVGVRGEKTLETGNLAEAFDFVIQHNGVDIYGGSSITGHKSLKQFFDESYAPNGVFLTNLSSGSDASFTFIAKFLPESGNEFQEKDVIFDLHLGLSFDLPEACADKNLDGNVIFGTQRNDILRGTNNGDVIIALEGNDIVQGGNGDDCIIGGPGNDVLQGQNGDDAILGDEGNDAILGGNGNDKLFGGSGNDAIKGENGDDIIFGGPNNDALTGENGDDQIYGEEGRDAISGGRGNDRIIGGPQIDSANGGLGIDVCEAEAKISCEM